MNKIIAELISFGLGLLSVMIGVVILIRKQYFAYGKTGGFLGTVSGKKAWSDGIGRILMGLLLIGVSIAIYLWGG